MKNPWLQIPASDYEAHMSLPEVAQAQALSGLMAAALAEYAPDSLAVAGCATGNGFEHIDPSCTRRVVGIDINPDYLAILGSRFGERIPGLELLEADIASPELRIEPVSMVFAALVFEYVDVARALDGIAKCLAPAGILLAVLQLPSPESSPVTPTPFKSLELLSPIMNLVPPSGFSEACATAGLYRVQAEKIALKKGKAFYVGTYRSMHEVVYSGFHNCAPQL